MKLTPAASTRTRTVSGVHVGSGTSDKVMTSGVPGPVVVIAFMLPIVSRASGEWRNLRAPLEPAKDLVGQLDLVGKLSQLLGAGLNPPAAR